MKPAANQCLAEFDHCPDEVFCGVFLQRRFAQAIADSGLTLLELCSHTFPAHGSSIVALLAESHAVLHSYPEAEHISVDVFTCSPEVSKIELLLRLLALEFKPQTVRTAWVNRGSVLSLKRNDVLQLSCSDGFDISLHIDAHLHQEISQYQKIEVVETRQFGRTLVLDREVQLTNSDAQRYASCIFSQLTKRGASLDQVLILGGGDGVLASFALSLNAKSVYVIDIDQQVRRVCEQYFPQFAKSAFEDPRCELAIGDILLLDFPKATSVIYDLSAHPEAFTNTLRRDFLEQVLAKAQQSLVTGGVIVVQAGSDYDRKSKRCYQEVLAKYFTELSCETNFIPSLMRPWSFFSAVCEETSSPIGFVRNK